MSADAAATLPLVSVVVPVLDGADHIGACLRSLLSQAYPSGRFEVLVVDNGSDDETLRIVRSYPGVRALTEDTVRSSYAARNRGVGAARGSVIAFIDADCVAEPTWLVAGVRSMLDSGADLVGGNVVFDYADPRSGAQLFDSITNMQVERNVRERSVAKTANLLVRAELFDAIGPFPGTVASGGDVAWTARATRAGHELVYAPDARVHHPARGLRELLRKQYRVGRGQPAAWIDQGLSRRGLVRLGLRTLVGRPTPARIRRELEHRGVMASRSEILRAWVAGLAAGSATVAGMVRSGRALTNPRSREVVQS